MSKTTNSVLSVLARLALAYLDNCNNRRHVFEEVDFNKNLKCKIDRELNLITCTLKQLVNKRYSQVQTRVTKGPEIYNI